MWHHHKACFSVVPCCRTFPSILCGNGFFMTLTRPASCHIIFHIVSMVNLCRLCRDYGAILRPSILMVRACYTARLGQRIHWKAKNSKDSSDLIFGIRGSFRCILCISFEISVILQERNLPPRISNASAVVMRLCVWDPTTACSVPQSGLWSEWFREC